MVNNNHHVAGKDMCVGLLSTVITGDGELTRPLRSPSQRDNIEMFISDTGSQDVWLFGTHVRHSHVKGRRS
jgi:hypothetical protein